MKSIGVGLGSAAQAGLSTYLALKQAARLDDKDKRESGMYKEWGDALRDWKARRGDRGGSQFGPNVSDDTSQAAQPVTAQESAAAGPAPTMQTMAAPTAQPVPQVAAPVGYNAPAMPAGLSSVPTPMITPQQQVMPYPGFGG